MKLKRSHKIIFTIGLIIVIWFFGIDNNTISCTNKIIIPLVAVAILGVAALGDILWKVSHLEDHPEERTKLED